MAQSPTEGIPCNNGIPTKKRLGRCGVGVVLSVLLDLEYRRLCVDQNVLIVCRRLHLLRVNLRIRSSGIEIGRRLRVRTGGPTRCDVREREVPQACRHVGRAAQGGVPVLRRLGHGCRYARHRERSGRNGR